METLQKYYFHAPVILKYFMDSHGSFNRDELQGHIGQRIRDKYAETDWPQKRAFSRKMATPGKDTCGGQGNGINGIKGVRCVKFKYCRIQGKELAANTMVGKGIFSMLNQMVTNGVMDEEDVGLFNEVDSWFVEKLPFPPQCKRQEKVICYFKTDNSEMMMKMIQPLLWLLERYRHPYYVVYTNFPGEIVYEDDYQIVVKVDENIVIEDIQDSWSPKEQDDAGCDKHLEPFSPGC